MNFDDYKADKKKKQEELELKSVLKALSEKKEIDYSAFFKDLLSKEVNLVGIVKAIKAIPTPKDVDLAPVVEAIKNIPAPKETTLKVPENKPDKETHRLLGEMLEALQKKVKKVDGKKDTQLISTLKDLGDKIEEMSSNTSEMIVSSTRAPEVVGIRDGNTGDEVDIQHPISVDGDSVYQKDVWVEESDTTDWTDVDGACLPVAVIPFTNLHTRIENATSDNPKVLKLHFNRTVSFDQIGLGCTGGGDFSNVKITVIGSGGAERNVKDESADNTKYTSRNVQFEPSLGNAVRIEFLTADPVCLSNITIQKVTKVSARLRAIKPDGSVIDIGATNNNNLHVSVQEYGDTPAIDSFDRLRTSEPFTLFDSKQLHDKQPLFWDEQLIGTATSTHVPTNAATEMSVSANGDSAIRQTKQRPNYQPGKSQLIFMTFLAPQVDNTKARIGVFDGIGVNYLTPNNGIFFECNGDLSWNIAKNGSITETVLQEDWNVDKLDGTGRSGINLDMEATQIAIIDFEWLGVGRVRTGFVIDGLIYYTHYFNHANDSSFDSVYMSSPNLPLRYSIESTGGAGSLDHICSTIMSEGGVEKTGVLRVADRGVSLMSGLGTGDVHPVAGIRLKSAYKDITVIPEGVSMLCNTSDSFRWSLHLNPTISGTFTYTDKNNSAVQEAFGNGSQEITDDGIMIDSGYASNQSRQTSESLNTALKIGTTIAGVQDELVLAITPVTNNASATGSLEFRELL